MLSKEEKNSMDCIQLLNTSNIGSVLQHVLLIIDLLVFVIISVSTSQQGTAGYVEARGDIWRGG